MVLRGLIDNYLLSKYKDGIVTLYINSDNDEYTTGTLDLDNDINQELIETIHLAAGLGNDFIAAIFPNSLDDSLKLIDEIQQVGDKLKDGEDIYLTIPALNTVKETGGSVLVLVFSTEFSGTILLAYDHSKMMKGSILLETDNGIQITH